MVTLLIYRAYRPCFIPPRMYKVIPFGSKETAYKTNAIAENLNLKVAFVERVRADIFRSPECLNNVLGDDSERQSRWFEARHRWTY